MRMVVYYGGLDIYYRDITPPKQFEVVKMVYKVWATKTLKNSKMGHFEPFDLFSIICINFQLSCISYLCIFYAHPNVKVVLNKTLFYS